MQIRTLLALAAVTIAATACGSDSKGTTDPGTGGPGNGQSTFTAAISGGVTDNLSGTAAFATDNADTDVGFAMGMGNQDEAVLIWRRTPGVLAAGQHAVANYVELSDEEVPDNQLVMIFFVSTAGGTDLYCAAKSGTLTVSNSAATRLRGTFNVTATCADITGQGDEFDVAVTGQFDATGGTVTLP